MTAAHNYNTCTLAAKTRNLFRKKNNTHLNILTDIPDKISTQGIIKILMYNNMLKTSAVYICNVSKYRSKVTLYSDNLWFNNWIARIIGVKYEKVGLQFSRSNDRSLNNYSSICQSDVTILHNPDWILLDFYSCA